MTQIRRRGKLFLPPAKGSGDVCLTCRLRRAAGAIGRCTGPLELPHLVAEGGGEPVPCLVDDECWERALAVVLGDDPGDLLPLDGAARGLVRLEQHVAHHLRHQLVLLLRRSPGGPDRFGQTKRRTPPVRGCTVVAGSGDGEEQAHTPPWRCRSRRVLRWSPSRQRGGEALARLDANQLERRNQGREGGCEAREQPFG